MNQIYQSFMRLKRLVDSYNQFKKATCGNSGKIIPDADWNEQKSEGTTTGCPVCSCSRCQIIREKCLRRDEYDGR